MRLACQENQELKLLMQFSIPYFLSAQSGIHIQEKHGPRFRKRLHEAMRSGLENPADKIVLNIDLWIVKV
jgi:hypothetical protein